MSPQEKLIAARKAYEEAAKEYLASVKATEEEIDQAAEILAIDARKEYEVQDSLEWDAMLADLVLDLRENAEEEEQP